MSSGKLTDRVAVTALPAGMDPSAEGRLAAHFTESVGAGQLLHVLTLEDDFHPQSLAFLLRLDGIVRDAGGTLCLVTSQPRAMSILSATRMDRIFKTFARVEAALTFLAPLARRLSA